MLGSVPTMAVTWILEPDLMPDVHARLRAAALAAQQTVETWSGRPPTPRPDSFVLFHGSLGLAAELATNPAWQPGAMCNTHEFTCSTWYPEAAPYLAHRQWHILPASVIVQKREQVYGDLRLGQAAFFRPNSPLKPFSGRVVKLHELTLEALDHGFYYDDPHLSVVIAPVREIGREWRYIVYKHTVLTGSAYQATTRTAEVDDPTGPPWRYACQVAKALTPPDPLYVLDIAEVDGDLRLMELNPFSGADLYACDLKPVVEAVQDLARTS